MVRFTEDDTLTDIVDRERDKRTIKKGSLRGRLVSANPDEGERFYLQLLLTRVCGPTDWKDLYTVNHVLYQIFRGTALERGLIENDNALSTCLEEGSLFQFPPALRRLFVTLLIFCKPEDVRKLWDDHCESFSKDYKHVDNDIQCVFFIYGPEGMRKTFLYKALLAKVRSRGLIALATASSDAAANNMSGGRTAHSRFKIPINL
nr:hypothetical protein [Tanacetum cinerariifolium]